MWWRCGHGHEWRARVAGRTAAGAGCPYCANSLASPEVNLAVLYPELVSEWSPKNQHPPETYLPGSERKVWWVCPYGHQWEASIKSRARERGSSCAKCAPQSSRIELLVFAEVQWAFPGAVWRSRIGGAEADIVIGPGICVEVDGEYWHRDREGLDRAKTLRLRAHGYRVIRLRERPLPALSRDDILFDERAPGVEIVCALFAYLLARVQVSARSRARLRSYLRKPALRAEEAYRALIANTRVPFPAQSLAVRAPHLVPQWSERNHPLTPVQFTANCHLMVWWRCAEGHEWRTQIATRFRGAGCPFCSGLRTSAERSLAVTHPALAKQWHPTRNASLTPRCVSAGSSRRVWWTCPRGHAWRAVIGCRVKCPRCPCCHGADHTLARVLPHLAREWHPTKNGRLRPEDVTPGTRRKVYWQCDAGHAWPAPVLNRRNGSGCPFWYARRRPPKRDATLRTKQAG